MYDMAKRSMAFAVATGGLLLAGPACAAAATAQDAGTPNGSVSASTGVGESVLTQALGARLVAPSGAVASGNSVDAPIDLGLNLCGNTVSVASSSSASGCSMSSGSTPTASADAAASTARPAGVLSGNAVRAPLNLSINACGNGAAVASAADSASGSGCTVEHSAIQRSALGTGMTGSADVLSQNGINVPISVPLNACGNGLSALSDTIAGTISCAIAEDVTVQPSSGRSDTGTSSKSTAGGSAGAAGVTAAGDVTGAGGLTAAGSATGANSSGSETSAFAVQPQTTTTTVTTTTTTTTSGEQQTTKTNQTQASSISLPMPMSVPAIQAGGTTSGFGGVTAASAPHTGTAPAAAPLPAAAPHFAQATVTANPKVIWPRPEPAAVPVAHSLSQVHPQADPPAGELAHTGAVVVAPVGAAAAALVAGAALRATGHHRR